MLGRTVLPVLYTATRVLIAFMRSIHEVLWAELFLAAFFSGSDPVTASLASTGISSGAATPDRASVAVTLLFIPTPTLKVSMITSVPTATIAIMAKKTPRPARQKPFAAIMFFLRWP